jgi:hypothetical protein
MSESNASGTTMLSGPHSASIRTEPDLDADPRSQRLESSPS